MTEKQVESIKLKITKYKRALAADKRMWGGQYHDGQGNRYKITAEYIKLQDYKEGLKHLKWFDTNFPDDGGHPIFLFEATLILFMCDKLKEAEEKAHITFFSNTYLLDTFLEKETLQFQKAEDSDWELEMLAKKFTYKKADYNDFAIWMETVLQSRTFLDKANEFIEIEQKLLTEPVGRTRDKLVNRLYKISYG